jgi:hypothetical protein
VSSDDFASTVAAMVGMEVPKVPDQEMVDYEATPKRGEVNVVILSADYYIIEDDSATAVLIFQYKMPHSRNQSILSIISSLCM